MVYLAQMARGHLWIRSRIRVKAPCRGVPDVPGRAPTRRTRESIEVPPRVAVQAPTFRGPVTRRTPRGPDATLLDARV